jgi:hypothetical protein
MIRISIAPPPRKNPVIKVLMSRQANRQPAE